MDILLIYMSYFSNYSYDNPTVRVRRKRQNSHKTVRVHCRCAHVCAAFFFTKSVDSEVVTVGRSCGVENPFGNPNQLALVCKEALPRSSPPRNRVPGLAVESKSQDVDGPNHGDVSDGKIQTDPLS
jgi:hypothetical protein